MSNIVLKVEDLCKQYRLGEVGTGTLSNDLNRWWYKIRGKEDHFVKVDESGKHSRKGIPDCFWALENINFEVKRGDVLGIIGKNGAGKSTLLKILSQVTSPTKGEVKIKGRIASLLEVGTGFQPELTGRENIFLNGAILGMTKSEIKRKFDEIVDFSGVERYIDTPVKRYSSGMYVRLAFGVAAHLEPEILIVDEVLAVGDAEFQKKCLGKMKDVSDHGRTVLFVSHNMAAVQSLCSTAIVLSNGKEIYSGNVNDAISAYYDVSVRDQGGLIWTEGYFNNDLVDVDRVQIGTSPKGIFTTDSELEIEISSKIKKNGVNILMDFILFNSEGFVVFNVVSPPEYFVKGNYVFNCTIPKHFLNAGSYSLTLQVVKNHNSLLYKINEIVSFEIEEGEREVDYYKTWPGIIRPRLKWKIYSAKKHE